ncbi:solute carrier family 52, riboflavin transporter, member 3 [Aplysia californica]|uniref:Riboflavin transporter n=1 Tax=Aplysia californica TaxID=6500 RepID=A0ABM0JLR7_APLCA|nr:solute carrier family 52, riboflavin transporter, member 3 [Aplysia californica]
MSQDLCRCGSLSFLTYLLVILFGVSSWVDINGLWVELPILVQNLPEGWDLPSYMAVIIQIANVAPFVYTVATTLWPHRVLELPVIYLIISVGAVSCLLLAFLWDFTSVIAGTEHSTALFVLQFFLALVDCTSSVAFLPFMSLLRPEYMTAYFIGEGFSGLVPSLVALGQGAGSMECIKVPIGGNLNATNTSMYEGNVTMNVMATNLSQYSQIEFLAGQNVSELMNLTLPTPPALYSTFPVYKEPKFTVRTFFLFLMCLLISSGIAFTLLNFCSHCKRDHVVESDCAMLRDESVQSSLMETTVDAIGEIVPLNDEEMSPNYDKISQVHFNNKGNAKHNIVLDSEHSNRKYSKDVVSAISSSESMTASFKKKGFKMPWMKYALFLFLTGWLNALSNGVLPSLQTYSCLPYGIRPYHLSVTLSNIANPVACFATFFLKLTSVAGTLSVSLVGTGLASFIILTAAMSPDPPLVGHTSGTFLVILAWVLVVFLLTFTKVSIATVFRGEGRKALLWIGASTQVGSLCGALITFFLVNFYKLFEVGNPCR